MTAKGKGTILNITGIILIICAFCILGSVVAQTKQGVMPSTAQVLLMSLSIASAIVGALYVFLGATKEGGAVLLKIFFTLNVIKPLIALVFTDTPRVIDVLGCIIPLLGNFILLVTTDLGKTRSYIIAWIVAIVHIVYYVVSITSKQIPVVALVSQTTSMIVSISVLAFIWAKYQDKKARGRL